MYFFAHDCWAIFENIPTFPFLFRILGYFLVGTLFCTLTTELAKYKIGRLRPYFLTVCKPDMSDAICKDQNGYQIFVTDYNCTAETEEEKHIVR
jgi:phosphatidate phosphatase